MDKNWDVIIIGGGPAGLAAAVYCGRALRKTLVLEKKVFGGQIVFADIIENYPGFAEPIVPADLMEQMSKQCERYGVVLENDEVQALRMEGESWLVDVYQNTYTAKAILYAAGSMHRFLGVPGEQELLGRGVSVCATCDAPFFLERKVAVLGGGDTALSEALHLAKYAAEVTLIHRRDKFRAEKILQDRVFKNGKIKVIWDSEVLAFKGGQRLEALEIRNKKSGVAEAVAFDGAFMAIGTIPNTELLKNIVTLDENGYVVTDISLRTEANGLFVAGEVIRGNRRQVAISVGMGVQAALGCEEYLAALD
ncbi:MAG: FAD-dependent oxidoreductase [Acidobacteria bacterium]|jgi:thioredoxin reductase (NADPH)|nr:FAD-dependent oxidoreductase [Acidobacteriota bacterium]